MAGVAVSAEPLLQLRHLATTIVTGTTTTTTITTTLCLITFLQFIAINQSANYQEWYSIRNSNLIKSILTNKVVAPLKVT